MNNGGGSRCAAQIILGLLCVGNRRQIIERSGEYSVGRDALIPPGRSIKHLPQTNPAALHTANLPQTCKSSVGDGVCCPVDGPENHDSFIGDMSGFALQTRQVLRQIQQWHIRQYFGTLKTVPYKITPPRETSAPTAGWLCIIYFRAIPHNSKCRYGERGAADAKPKAQMILDVLSSILATQMLCRSCRSGA